MNTWRSGIWCVCQKHLRDPQRLADVKCLVYGSRHMLQHGFHCLWAAAFVWLASVGETRLTAALQKNYFSLSQRQIWDAAWRGGVDKIVAGSYCGSQSQESWHRWKLKASLSTLRMPPRDVLDGLQSHFISRAKQASLLQGGLQDVPSFCWNRALLKEALKHPHV